MKPLAALALCLAATGLAGCGSAAQNPRASIEHVIRARQPGDTHLKFSGVRVSRLDPSYAVAREEFTRPSGVRAADVWILRRTGSAWRVTSGANLPTTCSSAPAKVRKELIGSTECYPPRGVYTSLVWTTGHDVRMRYCERPHWPGNFLAASRGVSCATAGAVIRTLVADCLKRGACAAASFHCRSYWGGVFGRPFMNTHHALCVSGVRRVLWDGG